MDIAELGFRVDSSGLVRGEQRLNRLDRAGRKAERGSRRLANSFRSVGLAASAFVGTAAIATFGFLTKGSIEAAREFQKLDKLLSESDLDFVRAEADRLGTSLSSSAEGFSKLTAATRGTRIEGQQTRDIFTGLSTAISGLNLGLEDSTGVTRAFTQIVSKGKLSAEELLQIGERVPGAYATAAKAIGLTTQELNKQLQLGNIFADDFLPKFAAELEKTYSEQALKGARQLTAEQNRFGTAFLEIRRIIGESGVIDAVTDQFRRLTSALKSDGATRAAELFGSAMAATINIVADLISVVSLSISGLVRLTSVVGGGLVDSFNAWNNLIFGGAIQLLNNQTRETIGIFDVLRGSFNDTRLVGISLIEGLLVGWERIRGGAEVLGIGIQGAFATAFDKVRTAFATLLETIAGGLRLTGLFDGVSASIDEFAAKVRGTQSAWLDYQVAIEESRAKTDEAVASVIRITSEMADLEIESKQASREIKKAATETDEFGSSASGASAGTKTLSGSIRSLTGLMGDLAKEFDDITNIYGEFGSAAEQVDRVLLDNQKSTFRLSELMKELNRRFPEGTRESKEYKEAIKSLGLETDETTDAMGKFWERFTDSAQDSLKSFIRSGLDGFDNMKEGFRNLGKNLISLAKDIVADLISTFASNALKNVFKNLFSGGGSGGGGGGLLGGIIGGIKSIFGGSKPGFSTPGLGEAFGGGGALLSGALGGIGKAIGGFGKTIVSALNAVPVWGQIALGIGALVSIFKSGARSPQQLGEDQLLAVDQATKEGRNEQIQLGQTAGVSLSFLGGFDENSTFFGIDLLKDELQKVGDVLKEQFGFKQALALKDGVIRLEDFSREFSKNNDEIVAEVQASIATVKLAFDNSERDKLKTLGRSVIAFDRLYDQSAASGKSAADRIREAYAGAFGVSQEAATTALAEIGISSDRMAQIFDTASDSVLEKMLGISSQAGTTAQIIEGSFNSARLRIEGSWEGLDLGQPAPVNVPTVNVPATTQQAPAQNQPQETPEQQESRENNDRIANNLDQMVPLIQQILATG